MIPLPYPESVTFDPLPTVGFIEFRGARVGIVHPEHRYRQRGRDMVRDAFQLHADDFVEGPRPSDRSPWHDDTDTDPPDVP